MRLIDADALIHELNNSHYPGAPYVDAGISIAIGKVCDAPTIEPERKTGKWIDKGWNGDWQYQTDGRGNCWHEWQCSECSHITKGAKWDFCPMCGADMREEGEEPEADRPGV